MFSPNPADDSTKGHVDSCGEECRTEQNEYVGDNVRSHCNCIIVCNAAADVTDDLDLISMQVSIWSSGYGRVRFQGKGVDIQKPPKVNAIQNHVLALNIFQE